MPETRSAQWLHEAGIGEERAILIEGGAIRAARVVWDEAWRAGAVAEAKLLSRMPGTRRGVMRLPGGTEALIDALDPALTEGMSIMVRVTRAAIAERGRSKLAHLRPATAGETACPAPSLLAELRSAGAPVRSVPITDRSFDEAGWSDLVSDALSGEVAFPGGGLIISPTPAMTLIDVDGSPPLPALALAAVPAIVAALGQFDIGGAIGIDFPSLADKRDRHAVDAALAAVLSDWRGERTAMNGFGFVQLVSRLERPSLIARYAQAGAGAAARMLLRQAERVSGPGMLLLSAHPAVRRAVQAEWEAELARRTGRLVRWQEDSGLALGGAFAQIVAA
ncbi:ribonuclease E/G [Novosphingobium sp. Chol11]|uniref:ribonuclease E/G n=1 Tax=Novosphingobium sp. Chol11 TaxID=1385763 RepID=UPI0025CC1C99|nr:ribonuclease E/G [Novosphingobium sp. Chol11]